MFKYLTFRQKLFFSQLFLFILFLIILIPFGERTVRQIVQRSLEETCQQLIAQIKNASDEQAIIRYFENQELFVFFRVSLLNDQGQLLYDSQLVKKLGENYQPYYQADHPEVEQALKKGMGYSEGWSEIFQRKFAYVAVRFDFQERNYVLRISFPFTQVQTLTQNFEIGIFAIDVVFLAIFFISMWFVFTRLSQPIHQIIEAIRPYQQGEKEDVPQIVLHEESGTEFTRLANTLNSLSKKVREQIRTVTEEKNEKEAILESLVEGVIAIDSHGLIRYANHTASKMLSIPKRHLLGKPFPEAEDKTKQELLEKCRAMLRIAEQQNTIVTDSISTGDMQKVYLDLIAAPKAHKSGAIIVLQDKSSHYKVLEMGKDFVANASHELRTPITIIKGFAETLQDLPQISHDMLADITEKIVRNCQRMETLVKNLLTLADIENIPETRFQETDFEAMLENCRHVLLSVYPDALVEIHREKERALISADPDLLELAFMNLFDNAAKYSKPPAKITVAIHVVKDEVKITVADQGMGIPEGDLDRVFDRFYTVNKSHSRRLGGAGLGLSIVKTIIEKHEGSITVSSQLGQGTTFTIFLPKHRHH
jgi:two-component system phosphate regulon sensor histidine kinase PhoR